MSDTCLALTESAIAAAQSATLAAAELLRYAREGEISSTFTVEPETIEPLADALRAAIEIDSDAAHARGDFVELLAEFRAALDRFLEGWA